MILNDLIKIQVVYIVTFIIIYNSNSNRIILQSYMLFYQFKYEYISIFMNVYIIIMKVEITNGPIAILFGGRKRKKQQRIHAKES